MALRRKNIFGEILIQKIKFKPVLILVSLSNKLLKYGVVWYLVLPFRLKLKYSENLKMSSGSNKILKSPVFRALS